MDKVRDEVREEVTSEVRVSFSIRSIISSPRAGSSCSVGSTPASWGSERGKANLVPNLVANLVVLRNRDNVDIELKMNRMRIEIRVVARHIIDKVWDEVRDKVTSEVRVDFAFRSIICPQLNRPNPGEADLFSNLAERRLCASHIRNVTPAKSPTYSTR